MTLLQMGERVRRPQPCSALLPHRDSHLDLRTRPSGLRGSSRHRHRDRGRDTVRHGRRLRHESRRHHRRCCGGFALRPDQGSRTGTRRRRCNRAISHS
uniref:Uncharacterized protein n=1 Tax=Leifsonia xyli subsp. cynodontis TaxID=31966 RepID=Q6EEG0_LEIXC|nr:unknown [Leifsonia xyli subsp. cynodontis]